MVTRIQVRRDIAINWTNVNPILASGEIGFELDTYKLKIGDGIKDWKTLDYFESGTGGGGTAGPVTTANTLAGDSDTTVTTKKYVDDAIGALESRITVLENLNKLLLGR